MISYRLIVKDADGNNIGEFEKFRSLKFGKRLNNYGSCQFEVPVDDPKVADLISLRRYTVHIYRDNGVTTPLLIWAGEQASRQGNLDDKGGNWVILYCYDWLEQLNSRFTDESVTFTNTDAGAIAWGLINTTQTGSNASFGITEGTITATQNRDRTYTNKNVLEAIIELSNVINGFDFEINNSKVFNVYESIGVDRSADIVLEYGINITTMRIMEDFSKIVNRAIILGDSGVALEPSRVDTDDASAQTLYKIREAISNELTTSETGTLEDKGEALIRKYSAPLYKITMGIVRGKTPTIGDFAIGDIITIKVQNGLYNINQKFRIFEWTLSYSDDNTETLDLVLGDFTIA